MARPIKAHQFWVRPADGPTAPVREAVAAINNANRSFEFTQHAKQFLAQDLRWDSRRGILTGTVYLLRSSNLPAAIQNGQVGPLPIGDETDLGEPMCFALHPDVGAAVVHYAHTGPRHSVLAAVIGHFLPDAPIAIEPVLRQDMLEQLRRKRFFRGLEFSLSDPKGVQELRTAGGSVGHALSMLDDLGGINIKVEITMGHSRGEGMAADATKAIARTLARVGAQHVEGPGGVSVIKVRGSDGEDAPVEELDLLHAREDIVFEVAETNRSIDTDDARRKLAAELNSRLPALRAQAGGG